MTADVRVVRRAERDAGTAQTPGMVRLAGVAASTCGARGVWMGEITNAPGFRSGVHHHGDVESAIYVLSGSMRVRWGDGMAQEADAEAGDFIYVPANVHIRRSIFRSERRWSRSWRAAGTTS